LVRMSDCLAAPFKWQAAFLFYMELKWLII